jgi:hypothetical protein
MKPLTLGIIVLASAGLLLLGACSQGAKTSDSASPNAAAPTAETKFPAATTPPATTMAKAHSGEGGKRKGGQVVESGKYHLELVPEQESGGTHLDFYVQKGDNHEAIATAKVIAQVQSPDGKQKTLPFTYDVSGKHYTAPLGEKAAGQYQLKIIATIGSDKVDGRFNVTQ